MNILKKTKFLGPMIKYKDKRNHGKRLLLKKKMPATHFKCESCHCKKPIKI